VALNWRVVSQVPGERLAVTIAVPVAAVLIVGAVCWRYRGSKWLASLVGVAVVVELVVLAPTAGYARRADPFVPPQWLTELQARLRAEPTARVYGMNGLLFPNTASAFSLYDIRYVDALVIQRYMRYTRAFLDPAVRVSFVGWPLDGPSSPRTPRMSENDYFNLLGVRYVVAATQLPDLKPVASDGGATVYENHHAFPRAFVVSHLDAVRNEDDATRALAAARRPAKLDLRREAVVEASGANVPRDIEDHCAGASASARIQTYEPNRLVIDVRSRCPGLLVLTDAYFPGWEATVNGQRASILPTDLAFRGVAVAAGDSRVVYQYRPASFRSGVGLAVAAAAALIAISVGIWFRAISKRRRPTRALEA
jgi:hypothetical protein